MKKLLFLLTLTFIGQQAFSQMYIVTLSQANNHVACGNFEPVLSIVTPNGSITYICLGSAGIANTSNVIGIINQELNNIINQGYKLIETNNGSIGTGSGSSGGNGFINITGINYGTTWYLAVPWSVSGLEEISTTVKSFIISPNPANTYVDISLDYSLKGENEIVFISEAGYISHKQSIGEILKNAKYNIDISKIPAGKYLVTIVNDKTYTTPQKLIIL